MTKGIVFRKYKEGGDKPEVNKTITSITTDDLAYFMSGAEPGSVKYKIQKKWIQNNPEQSKKWWEENRHLFVAGNRILPEVEIEDKFEPSVVLEPSGDAKPFLTKLDTKEKAKAYNKIREGVSEGIDLATSLVPVLGDIKDIYENAKDNNAMGLALTGLSVIPAAKAIQKTAKAVKKVSPYIKNATVNVRKIKEPVYVYGEDKLINALPKNLRKNVENVQGAYKFQDFTTYEGKTFNPGDIVEENSARIKLSLPEYLKNRSVIKKALRETGQESALVYSKNPLMSGNSEVIIEKGISPAEMVRKHGVTGASKVGNTTMAIKNLSSSQPKISPLNIFQNPKGVSASLIFKKNGGLILKKGHSIPKYKDSGIKDDYRYRWL